MASVNKNRRRNAAIQAGYTEEISAYCMGMDLVLLVKPDTDITDEFIGCDAETGDLLSVNGYELDFEYVNDLDQ